MTGARDLEPLFAPSSVAVLGASTDPSKWGNWLARNALRGAHRRPVHLINRRGGEIDGHPLLASLADAGGQVETVVVSVPEAGLEQAVEESLAQGARALIVITAGLAETGEAGRARERALVARVRGAGAVMLGPNCIGVYDALSEFHVSSNAYPAGPVGLISQSGNLSIELGMLLERCGLGLSRFASIGNQADVRLPDLVEHLAGHEPTRAIAIYAEDVADGRAFVEAARAAARQKPVVLLNSGRSAAGARGAASHTGALVTSDAVIAAACREAGVVRVDSPGELVDACLAFVRSPRARGRRVAVLADGGGHGSVAADLLTAGGLEVPTFSAGLMTLIELPGRVDAHDARLAAGGGDHRVARHERARVRGRAARAGGRAAAVEQDHGLLPCRCASGLDEGTAVGDVLGVDRDRPGGLVAREVLDQVGQPHIGLIADRGEAREAEPAALEQHAELDRQVARLRDQADGARRIGVGRDVELRERVVHADAVGPEHDGARAAHPRDEGALAGAAGLARLGEARGDHDQRARALCQRFLDGLLEARLGDGDDDGLDLPAGVGEAREQGMAVDLAAAAVDQVHGPAVRAAQRVAREPVAPLAGIRRGAQHGDRGRREERLQIPRSRHSSPFAIAREMIRRWMSELPSQISCSLASRNHFSTGYSRE